jgi:hypothetical protein
MRLCATRGVIVTAVCIAGAARAAQAQDCRDRSRIAVGVAVGNSGSTTNIDPDAVNAGIWEDVTTTHGPNSALRLEAEIGSYWRMRVEVSRSSWGVRHDFLSSMRPFPVIRTTAEPPVGIRETTVAVGRGWPRWPHMPCWYVLGGAGRYTLSFAGVSVRKPGVFAVGGLDLPLGRRSSIVAEIRFQAVSTHDQYPFQAYDVLSGSVSIGWIVKF